MISHRGRHYRVQNARLFTLPDELPPIHVAASGPRMAELAGRIGDGFIGTGPDEELLTAYREAGGDGPRFGQVTLCWGSSEAEARRRPLEWWPTAALHGEVTQELPNPAQFTDLVKDVTEDQVAEVIPCGPDAEVHLERDPRLPRRRLRPRLPAPGRPGPGGLPEFAEAELLPELTRTAAAVALTARPGRGPSRTATSWLVGSSMSGGDRARRRLRA